MTSQTGTQLRKEKTQDELVREQIKEKDLSDIQSMYKDLQDEEKELKEFFTDMKKPVDKDPTMLSIKQWIIWTVFSLYVRRKEKVHG